MIDETASESKRERQAGLHDDHWQEQNVSARRYIGTT